MSPDRSDEEKLFLLFFECANEVDKNVTTFVPALKLFPPFGKINTALVVKVKVGGTQLRLGL